MIKFRTTGYQSESLFADISLGIFDGLDNALWCYAFATVIFAGAMAQFLPLLVVILLCGWAVLGIFVAVTSEKSLHIVSLDEQAVVILASIAGLMVAYMGDMQVNTNGLATMLAIMSLSSLGVAFFFWVIGHLPPDPAAGTDAVPGHLRLHGRHRLAVAGSRRRHRG